MVRELLVEHPQVRYENGTCWGGVSRAAKLLGIPGEELREDLDHDKVTTGTRRVDNWYGGVRTRVVRRRQGYPTAAQWCRRHPEVKAAVLRGTGHAGFMFRDPDGVAHVFDMGARKRIDHAVVIEWEEEADV